MNSEHINNKWWGIPRFRLLKPRSLVSDPKDLATWSQNGLLIVCKFQQDSPFKNKHYFNGAEYLKIPDENEPKPIINS